MARVRKQKKQERRVTRPLHAFTTYGDCLAGRAPMPADPAGKLLFQFLVVGGMVTFMGTFNGLRHSGFDFFVTHHWIYPLIACVALALRLAFVGKLVERVASIIIDPRLDGVVKNLAMTTLNVGIMAPIMTCVTTLLLYGTSGYLYNIAHTLPVSMMVSFMVNLFVVAPIVKMVYNNLLNTERGIRWLACIERTAMPWMAIFNS